MIKSTQGKMVLSRELAVKLKSSSDNEKRNAGMEISDLCNRLDQIIHQLQICEEQLTVTRNKISSDSEANSEQNLNVIKKINQVINDVREGYATPEGAMVRMSEITQDMYSGINLTKR